MPASSRTRHREGEDPQKISKEETRRGTQKQKEKEMGEKVKKWGKTCKS